MSLRAICESAAIRLCQSGSGITALSPFREPSVPLAPAGFPPLVRASHNPLHPPHPAPVSVRPSGYAAGPTENWRAITQQQLPGKGSKRDLFELTCTLQLNQEMVCADAHLNILPPLEPFAPQGAGSLLLLGARLARGGAPAKEGWGFSPYPVSARAIFSRRLFLANAITQIRPLLTIPTVLAVRAPAGRYRTQRSRGFAHAGVARAHREEVCTGLRRNAVARHLSHHHDQVNAVQDTAVHTEPARRPTCSHPGPALCYTPGPATSQAHQRRILRKCTRFSMPRPATKTFSLASQQHAMYYHALITGHSLVGERHGFGKGKRDLRSACRHTGWRVDNC